MITKIIQSIVVFCILLLQFPILGLSGQRDINPFHPLVFNCVDVVTGEYREQHTDIDPSGTNAIPLGRQYSSTCEQPGGWQFNHPNFPWVSSPCDQNIQESPFDYIFDDSDRLLQVHQKGEGCPRPLYHFHYKELKESDCLECTVTHEEGRWVEYLFSNTPASRSENPYLLLEVRSSKGSHVQYSYIDHPRQRKKLLSKREEPNGRYLIVEYYDKFLNAVGDDLVKISDLNRDKRLGRVKLLKIPSQTSEEPIIAARFFYYDGYTEVYDAENHKTVYRFGNHDRLTAIEEYADHTQVYRTTRFFWGRNSCLASCTLEDAAGGVRRCETYEYDAAGQMIALTLHGNLTGSGKDSFAVDSYGQPIGTDIEAYSIRYAYTNDPVPRLQSKTEDNGRSETYAYDPQTGKLTSRLIKDCGQVRIREFYSYSPSGDLILHVVDDGTQPGIDDFGEAATRRTTRIVPKAAPPAKGLPEIIEEFYRDFTSQTDILLKRTLLYYGETGNLLLKEIFGPNQERLSWTAFDYDSRGRVIREHDSLGNHLEQFYDGNGNLLEVIRNREHTATYYDRCNRVIRQDLIKEHSPIESETIQYNSLGLPIAAQDYFGNATEFTYDPFGRLQSKKGPPVKTASGGWVRPTTTQIFDVFDRPIETIDPNGNKISTTYNVRGSPVKITYPDGSTERNEYCLDGSLKKKTDRKGLATVYARDYQNRPLKESHWDSDNRLMSSIERGYSAFQLIKETDSNGKTTLYDYDSSGKNIKITCIHPDSIRCSEILYDLQGDPVLRKDYDPEHPEHSVAASIQKNEERQLVGITLQNHLNETVKSTSAAAPQSKNSTTTYLYDHFNSLGQNVLKSVEVDPEGLITSIEFDALKRPVSVTLDTPLGQCLKHKQIDYDPAGNKVQETYLVDETSTSSCRWDYTVCNQIASFTEDFRGQARTTFYEYYSGGDLKRLTKPDGISLSWEYDPCGKPSRIYSSDGTIDYCYRYDHKQRVSVVEDAVHRMSTRREYNAHDLVSCEALGNGLTLLHKYDARGRKIEMELPDSSKVVYTHDPVYLRTIARVSPEGAQKYVHHYKNYSLSGKATCEELIGNLGHLQFQYDVNEQLSGIETQYWRQSIERNPAHRIRTVRTLDPDGLHEASYAYDPAGQLIQDTCQAFIYDRIHNRNALMPGHYGCPDKREKKSYEYDPNGNLIRIADQSGILELEYDAFNRLTKVSKGQEFSDSYLYDPYHRCLISTSSCWDGRMQQWQPVESLRYLYDGMHEIGAFKEHGIAKELRILEPNSGRAIAIEAEGSVYAPIHDHRGSIACLLDTATGEACEWYRYSSFGLETTMSPSGSLKNPWRFAGKRTHTGTGLVNFGFRHYLPDTGCWITQDPLGTPDSINRYVYCLNDPINKTDPYGLSAFDDFWKNTWNFFQSTYQFFDNLLTTVRTYASITDMLYPFVDAIGQAVFGKPFLLLSGFYDGQSLTGVYGKGELHDKARITLINGILNARVDFKESLEIFSDLHGGTNIHFIFDATGGWCWDMLKSLLVKCGYISPQAHQIADTWHQLIDEMGGVGGGGTIYHYAHSIGCAHTQAALRLMTPEEKNLIKIFTLGTPLVISDPHVNEIRNYVSVRDGVCLLDPIGYFGGLCGWNPQVIPVGDWLGMPLVDHFLNNGTYLEVIRLLAQEFLDIYAY